jgi:hypothetical protein
MFGQKHFALKTFQYDGMVVAWKEKKVHKMFKTLIQPKML